MYLNGSIHGLSRHQISAAMDEIVTFAGLEEFIDLPLRLYSSGMIVRLGFAIASHIQADVLLLDEVFAVGDEAFQRRCVGKLLEFKRRGGTIVFVSHDAAAVERLCQRAILLDAGHVTFDGAAAEAMAAYRHLLTGERAPAERAAGLKEWGGEVAHVERTRLIAAGGEQTELLASEPFALTFDVVRDRPLPPPYLSWQLRDDDGSLVAGGAVATAALGWHPGMRRARLRFDVARPPLRSGHFRLRTELADASGERLYHSLDDALVFAVHVTDGAVGVLRLDGRWSLIASAMSRQPASRSRQGRASRRVE